MIGRIESALGGTLMLLAFAACSDDSSPPPGSDKGGAVDKGTVAGDSGSRDAGAKEKGAGDQGPAKADAPAAGCGVGFAGCTTFTDGTGAAQTVSFPSLEYSPKCLKVKVGQAVSFSGSFSAHPLEQACGPSAAITATSTGSSASFTFTKPGLYGYYCTLHGTTAGSGMAGAIEVVP